MEDQSIKKSTIGIIIAIVLIVLLGTWAYVKYGTTLLDPKGAETEEVAGATDESAIGRITAKHQWKNGTHIVAGEVNLPTPCYVLETEARIAESMPEQVTLAFTATTGTDVCAQVITPERFKIDFKASKDATIKATWNGEPVILNLIPAGENEDLANFELFIKG